jgi:magnesium chelatase subunit I
MSTLLPDFSSGAQRSRLLEMLSQSGARRVLAEPTPDLGIAEHLPFPFLAIVGQFEMRTALLLAVINPAVGGVLLIGPRGTGKTTCVRSLTDLLPYNEISDQDDEEPDESGDQGFHLEPVKLVELPLNARVEDVVGGINERIAVQQGRVRLERGILSRADQNLLYIDEVNLLDDLRLRPQIMDRFGLRVPVQGLLDPAERLEVYRRVRRYQASRRRFLIEWAELTAQAREEIILARELLKETELNDQAVEVGLRLVHSLGIDSHRAEYAMFEAARAHAAADGRDMADVRDIRAVAPMALRQRRSQFMTDFFVRQSEEDLSIRVKIEEFATEFEE